MNRKSKGIKAERELNHLFWAERWACVRVAGSGASRYPTPDLLASNGKRVLAIECKSSKSEYQYLDEHEIEDLKRFSAIFGAEAWIGVRFSGEAWKFYRIKELKKTAKAYMVSRKSDGLSFEVLVSRG
jgi:Holliday junction resolvase